MNRVRDERRWRGHGVGGVGGGGVVWDHHHRPGVGGQAFPGLQKLDGGGEGLGSLPATPNREDTDTSKGQGQGVCLLLHCTAPPTEAHLSCIWFRAPSCFLHLFGSVLLSPGIEGTKMSETQPLSKSPKYKLILSACRMPSTVLSVLQGLIHLLLAMPKEVSILSPSFQCHPDTGRLSGSTKMS